MYFLVCSRLFYPTTVEIMNNNNNNNISDSDGADWTGPHTFQALYNPRKLFLVSEEYKVLNVIGFVRKNKSDKEPKSILSQL